MAFTYVGSSVSHADNTTALQPGTPVAVSTSRTLSAGAIQAGDVGVLSTFDSGGYGARAINIVEDGGQSFTSLALQVEEAFQMQRAFVCQFTGALSVDLSTIPVGDGYYEAYTVCLDVFRPTSASNPIAVDVTQAAAAFADPASLYDVTIAGQSPAASSSFTLAFFQSYGLATWSTLTGGWSYCSPAAQQRNSSMSVSRVYKINTTSGATGSVTNRMATNHARGLGSIVTIKETASAGALLWPRYTPRFNPLLRM